MIRSNNYKYEAWDSRKICLTLLLNLFCPGTKLMVAINIRVSPQFSGWNLNKEWFQWNPLLEELGEKDSSIVVDNLCSRAPHPVLCIIIKWALGELLPFLFLATIVYLISGKKLPILFKTHSLKCLCIIANSVATSLFNIRFIADSAMPCSCKSVLHDRRPQLLNVIGPRGQAGGECGFVHRWQRHLGSTGSISRILSGHLPQVDSHPCWTKCLQPTHNLTVAWNRSRIRP